MDQEMKTKLSEINERLKEVSDNIYSVQSEKKKLLQTEDEIHSIFRLNDRVFQDLKNNWKYGEMSNYVQEVDVELKHHERKMRRSLEDEMHVLHQKTKFFEEKESELQHELRLLSLDDDSKT